MPSWMWWCTQSQNGTMTWKNFEYRLKPQHLAFPRIQIGRCCVGFSTIDIARRGNSCVFKILGQNPGGGFTSRRTLILGLHSAALEASPTMGRCTRGDSLYECYPLDFDLRSTQKGICWRNW